MDGKIVALSLTRAGASPSLQDFDAELIEHLLLSGEMGAIEGLTKEGNEEK